MPAKKILIPCEALYNEFELYYPFYRLKEAGCEVVVAGPEAGATYKSKIGLPVTSDVAFTDLKEADFDGLVIPGGYAPDRMRRSSELVRFTADMHAAGKLVAFICHAGWLPISAGILDGSTATSFFAIRDDMVNAGVNWVDREVVVDGNLISSRTPDDLPAFLKAIVDYLA